MLPCTVADLFFLEFKSILDAMFFHFFITFGAILLGLSMLGLDAL